MIIVAGTIELPSEHAPAMAALARECMEITRTEDGCAAYNLTRSVERPGEMHVYEEWESLDHLAAHGKSDHLKRFREGLAKLGEPKRRIRKFEAGPEV